MSTLAILNNIRNQASADYQARIPIATRENITEIGNSFTSYELEYNEFCSALFHKIGKTIIESNLFNNKLAKFKTGTILNQQDVEEIFVGMAKSAVEFDPTGNNPLGRRTDESVKIAYHRLNRQNVYEFTVSKRDFLRAFTSEATLENFVKQKINSVYSRASHDEWLLMKNLLATFDGYYNYEVPVISNENSATTSKTFVKTLRKAINDVSFATELYTKAKVLTWTDTQNLVLFVNKDLIAEIDVEVLAKAFNMGKTDINVDIVVLDDFGTLTDTYALLLDKDFFRVWDTYSALRQQENAQGDFTNYFYHVTQILSTSPYKTAVRFKTVAQG